MLYELVRYQDKSEFPFDDHPVLSDYFLTFGDNLAKLRKKEQIKGIVSLFPTRPRKTKMDILPFYSFSSNRTGYAALRLLEGVFAEFYLQTDILPVINPIHSSYLDRYKDLPRYITKKFQERGVVLYAR